MLYYKSVDILILGAGWTSTFLIPLCVSRNVTYAATSRPKHSKPGTIPFEFDENNSQPDKTQFARLPDASTVLITFPIAVKGASERLVRLYEETRTTPAQLKARFIQLGSSGLYHPTIQEGPAAWADRHSPIVSTDPRGIAEQELLALSPKPQTTVLSLAGLWGGTRKTKNWIGRLAMTKEAVEKMGNLHMVHGEDVSRAILAVHDQFEKAAGQRWLITDGRVYDWWDLVYAWGIAHAKARGEPIDEAQDEKKSRDRGPHPAWVRELMRKHNVRALPRSAEQMGRGLDSRDFWDTFELEPSMGRLE